MTDVQQLITQLDTTDFQASDAAQHALIALGSAAVDPLIAALQGPAGQSRTMVISILAAIKDRRAVQPLLRIVQNPSDKDTVAAAVALADMDEASAIPSIHELIQSQPLTTLNKSLLKALDRLGDHDWVINFACRGAFENKNNYIDRRAMREILEPANTPATTDLILRYLRTNHIAPDEISFAILGKMRSQPVNDYLLELLSHPSPVVRGNAIYALVAADYKDAVKAIKALERDESIYRNSDQDGPRQTVGIIAKYAVKKLKPGWRLW